MALWFSDLAKIPEIKVCFADVDVMMPGLVPFFAMPWFVLFIYVSINFCPGPNKDPPSFLETYFEGVPLLQCRVLWRKPSFVRNFCCAQHQGLWRQAHSDAR